MPSVLDKRARVRQDQALKARLAELEPPRALIAESLAMKGILALVQQVSASEATILLQGESGTGKELLARALLEPPARPPPHYRQLRRAPRGAPRIRTLRQESRRGARRTAAASTEGA